VVEDALTAHHLPPMAHEEFEQIELLSRQAQFFTSPAHSSRAWFKHQVGDHKPLGRFARAAKMGPDSSDQLFDCEWLHQVVVGPVVEAPNAIWHGVSRGEHDHGHSHTTGAKLTTDMKPVETRQRQVEHDGIGRLVHSSLEAAITSVLHQSVKPFFFEDTDKDPAQVHLVLDDQD
jgi:hypothetical protein